jgi:hypothetical protein
MDEDNIKDQRLTHEEYDNLLSMLKSSKEDQLVAFSCINTYKLLLNTIPFLFLRKESNLPTNSWTTHCPYLMDYQNNLCKDLTMGSILNVIKDMDKRDQEEDLKFFFDRFNKFVKDGLISHFPFMKNYDLQIIEKTND